MRHVDFDPVRLTGERKAEWDAWLMRADAATTNIVQTFEARGKVTADDFNGQIWSDLKAWLLKNVFDQKCAYCETHIKQARQPGHAEHFRPKGAIKNKETRDGQSQFVVVRTRDPDDHERPHPGYFWLAYNWENLVPSCNDCNTGRGKNNQFPTAKPPRLLRKLKAAELARLQSRAIPSTRWPGFYYLGPRDLDKDEERLLLHPYFDEPHEHIQFGIKGIETAREIDGEPSPKGVSSIRAYELDSDDLRRARSMAQMLAWNVYSAARQQAINEFKTPEQAHEAGEASVARALGKNPPFATAIEDFIQLYR